MTARILTTDIETSPNIAHVWGLFNQNISLNQLMESTQMLSFASKWYGDRRVEFRSVHHDGQEQMVLRAHELIDEADIVVHYNGRSFDMKHLNREFIEAGLRPPSPVMQIDLMRVVKGQFRFASNKLQHVSTELGLEGKTSHTGHDLWVQCLAGNAKAWSLMRKYNKQDVVLTEKLYDKLQAWVPAHPHLGLINGVDGASCGRCGSDALQKRGFRYTMVSKFQRYQCLNCGGWSSAGKALDRVDVRVTG